MIRSNITLVIYGRDLQEQYHVQRATLVPRVGEQVRMRNDSNAVVIDVQWHYQRGMVYVFTDEEKSRD